MWGQERRHGAMLALAREELGRLPADTATQSPQDALFAEIGGVLARVEALDVSQPCSWIEGLWSASGVADIVDHEPDGSGTSLAEIPRLHPPFHGAMFLEAPGQHWFLPVPTQGGEIEAVNTSGVGFLIYAEQKPADAPRIFGDYIEDRMAGAREVIHVFPFLLTAEGKLIKPFFYWLVPILPGGAICTLNAAGQVPTMLHAAVRIESRSLMNYCWHYQPLLMQAAFSVFCARFSGVPRVYLASQPELPFADPDGSEETPANDAASPPQPAVRRKRLSGELSLLDASGLCSSLDRLLAGTRHGFTQALSDFEEHWRTHGVGQ